MDVEPYGHLAEVYEFLVPEALLEPEGAVAAFADVLRDLAPGARVLDCAAGIGTLAVGLAQQGHRVTATDASAAMVARTEALARRRGVEVETRVCTWEQLDDQLWLRRFDAILCVGNSLAHAHGQPGRRAALRAMAKVLQPGGWLAVTSRNWERVRERPAGLEVAGRLVERTGRRAVVVNAWTIEPDWADRHRLDVAVAILGEGGEVRTVTERLDFWPFTPGMLDEDLGAAGLTPHGSTFAADVDRYLVTARKP